jgi:putative redox protein
MSTHVHAVVDPGIGRVEARTDTGQTIVMDADPPHGSDSAAGPIETLLAALAACTAMDVRSILRKKRQDATSYEIDVVGEQAAEHPRILTAITVEHRVRGRVEPEAIRRSVELSATQYCPVSAMLSAVARVEHRYRLEAEDGTVHEAVVAVVGPESRRGQA